MLIHVRQTPRVCRLGRHTLSNVFYGYGNVRLLTNAIYLCILWLRKCPITYEWHLLVYFIVTEMPDYLRMTFTDVFYGYGNAKVFTTDILCNVDSILWLRICQVIT